jgi:hypothetical protein
LAARHEQAAWHWSGGTFRPSRITRIARCRLTQPGGTMKYRSRPGRHIETGIDVMDEMTRPVWYEIRVRGRMGGMLLVAFPDLSAQADGTETVLTGPLVDQAALYGVLAQIEALGLELLEVHRTGG